METCNVGFDRPCLSALRGVNADIFYLEPLQLGLWALQY